MLQMAQLPCIGCLVSLYTYPFDKTTFWIFLRVATFTFKLVEGMFIGANKSINKFGRDKFLKWPHFKFRNVCAHIIETMKMH